MYTVGQLLQGETYAEDGEEVIVIGKYEFTTDDPEEYIQDIGLRLADGRLVYCSEQCVCPVIYL